jgi:hypothetical protein
MKFFSKKSFLIPCLNLALSVLPLFSGQDSAKDYHIAKGGNFASGTLNLNHWFMGGCYLPPNGHHFLM